MVMRGAPSAETHGRAAARHAPPPRPHRCHDATSLVPSTISCRRLFVRQTQLALALSTLVLVSDLCGQAPLDAAVRTLKPGQTVRIRAHGGDRIESRILSVRADSATLSLEGASTPLDGAAIDSLWVRGRATGTGAIIGAAVLGIASIPVGPALCGGLSESARSLGGSEVSDMPTSELVITTEPTPGQIQYLEDRIYEFNSTATGITDGEWLAIFVRDEADRIAAGICGNTWGGCFEIRQFWVEEARRKQGLGTRLLEAAQQEASRRGCRQILLMTFTFQAPALYA